jgi:hypothetical protein
MTSFKLRMSRSMEYSSQKDILRQQRDAGEVWCFKGVEPWSSLFSTSCQSFPCHQLRDLLLSATVIIEKSAVNNSIPFAHLNRDWLLRRTNHLIVAMRNLGCTLLHHIFFRTSITPLRLPFHFLLLHPQFRCPIPKPS